MLHRFAAGPVETFIYDIFRALGAENDVAQEVSQHLVRANLSGHDSHGVLRVKQYVKQTDTNEIAPSGRPRILRENRITAVVDAGRGFGHYSTAFALDWACERAAQHGLAAVAVRHSTHIGRLGEYSERAAGRGLIAIVTVGAAGPGVGGMFIHGGRRRFLGANPWSIGVPAEGRPPMVFDASATTVAEGKVRVARDKGVELPPDCIVDAEGKPSLDPNDLYAGGSLVPLGAKIAGHKGYGLALASALLSGLGMIGDTDPTLIGAHIMKKDADARGRIGGVFLEVLDPAAFGDAQQFRRMVSETLKAAKREPSRAGFDEILIPGEPELRMRDQRGREGIPLPEQTRRDLTEIAERFELEIPEPLK